MSYSSSCHHSPPPSPLASVKSRMETFCTSLPACPGCSGKWLLNERCHWLLVALLMKSLPVPLHTLNPFLYLYIPVKSWHYQSEKHFSLGRLLGCGVNSETLYTKHYNLDLKRPPLSLFGPLNWCVFTYTEWHRSPTSHTPRLKDYG